MVGFDVLVSSSSVVVYAGFTAPLDTDGPRFPVTGGCASVTDAYSYAPSCLTTVAIDGVQLATISPTLLSNPFSSSSPVTADAMLQVTGCGTTIEAPLHARTGPAASGITTMRATGTVTVGWAATNADVTLVDVGSGFSDLECLEPARTHAFPDLGNGAEIRGFVQPLLGPEITETRLGQVRVWYGDATGFTVP